MTVGRLALAAILLAVMPGATCDAGGGVPSAADDVTPTPAPVLAATPTVGSGSRRRAPDGAADQEPSPAPQPTVTPALGPDGN